MGTFRLGRSIENGYEILAALQLAKPRSQHNAWVIRSTTAVATHNQWLLGGLDARYYD